MAFSDMDAAAEIAQMSRQIAAMSGQLTTALVQIAEIRGEQSAARRDMDRILSERRANDAAHERQQAQVQAQVQPLAVGWSGIILVFCVLSIALALMWVIYAGGRLGG